MATVEVSTEATCHSNGESKTNARQRKTPKVRVCYVFLVIIVCFMAYIGLTKLHSDKIVFWNSLYFRPCSLNRRYVYIATASAS